MRWKELSCALGLLVSPAVATRAIGQEANHQEPAGPEDVARRGLAAAKAGRFREARRDLSQVVPFNDAFGEGGEPRWTSQDAAYQLGILFRDGLGGDRDANVAGRCFVLALGEGAPLGAYLALADLYRKGIGVPMDPIFSTKIEDELLIRARNPVWWGGRKGDAIRAANMFVLGKIFPSDLLAAADLYYVAGDKTMCRNLQEQAAREGSAEAHWKLANSFLGLGWPVTARDPQQAAAHFQSAGQLGMAQAWFNLGVLYQDGIEIPKDEAKAFECFQKSGDFGAYYLGMAYWAGRVTKRDVVKARLLLLKASKQDRFTRGGLPVLAEIYLEGLGTPKDPVLAARYFPLIAFKQSPPPAAPKARRPWEGEADLVVDIDKLLLQDAPAESWLEYGKALQDVTRVASAAKAFERAKDLGSARAEWMLGRLLQGDWGMSSDDMAAVVEPLGLSLAKGRVLIESAVRKGISVPAPLAAKERDWEFEHRKGAEAYPEGDPRRLFHQIRAWEYAPKD